MQAETTFKKELFCICEWSDYSYFQTLIHYASYFCLSFAYIMWIFIPGHMDVQDSLCIISPWQSSPPPLGVGLLHVLCLFCIPRPQDAVHSVHCDQVDQPPLTAKKKKLKKPYNMDWKWKNCIQYNQIF